MRTFCEWRFGCTVCRRPAMCLVRRQGAPPTFVWFRKSLQRRRSSNHVCASSLGTVPLDTRSAPDAAQLWWRAAAVKWHGHDSASTWSWSFSRRESAASAPCRVLTSRYACRRPSSSFCLACRAETIPCRASSAGAVPVSGSGSRHSSNHVCTPSIGTVRLDARPHPTPPSSDDVRLAKWHGHRSASTWSWSFSRRHSAASALCPILTGWYACRPSSSSFCCVRRDMRKRFYVECPLLEPFQSPSTDPTFESPSAVCRVSVETDFPVACWDWRFPALVFVHTLSPIFVGLLRVETHNQCPAVFAKFSPVVVSPIQFRSCSVQVPSVSPVSCLVVELSNLSCRLSAHRSLSRRCPCTVRPFIPLTRWPQVLAAVPAFSSVEYPGRLVSLVRRWAVRVTPLFVNVGQLERPSYLLI